MRSAATTRNLSKKSHTAQAAGSWAHAPARAISFQPTEEGMLGFSRNSSSEPTISGGRNWTNFRGICMAWV
jgi:hypothetical protein